MMQLTIIQIMVESGLRSSLDDCRPMLSNITGDMAAQIFCSIYPFQKYFVDSIIFYSFDEDIVPVIGTDYHRP